MTTPTHEEAKTLGQRLCEIWQDKNRPDDPAQAVTWDDFDEEQRAMWDRAAFGFLASQTELSSEMRSLEPDAEDIRLCSTAALPCCPLCGGSPATMTRHRADTGIFRSLVACTQCGCEVAYNALTKNEARQGAICRWEKRPEAREIIAYRSQQEGEGEPAAWLYEWTPHQFEQWAPGIAFKDPRVHGVRRYRNVQPLYLRSTSQEEGNAWAWLSERINLELSWGEDDNAAEGDPGVWRVHRRSGNRSDREWELVGSAETALGAVLAARTAIDTPPQPSPTREEGGVK